MLHRAFLLAGLLFFRQKSDATLTKEFAVFRNDKKISVQAVDVFFPKRPEQLHLIFRVIRNHEMVKAGDDQRVSRTGKLDVFQRIENPAWITGLPLVEFEL